MSITQKKKIKKIAISWLCVAVLASSGAVTGFVPSVVPAVTVSADDSVTAEQNIELGKIADYLSGKAVCPDGVTVKTPELFDDIIELTISKSGTYKLSGSNYINGSYLDVKIIIADGADVTLNCDDAYIKNDKGEFIEGNNSKPDEIQNEYSYQTDGSGHHLYNIVHPFKVNDGCNLTLKGKLFMDTFSTLVSSWHNYYAAKFYDSSLANINYGDINYIYYHKYTDDEYSFVDVKYCINGALYNLDDYVSDHVCEQVKANAIGDKTFSNHYTIVNISDEHKLADENADTCEYCGHGTFTITYDDGTAQTTAKAWKNLPAKAPADPADPPCKKFAGWYTADDKKYDFTAPVTENITLTAKYEERDIEGITIAMPPIKTTYIEGTKFEPNEIAVNVTYDDGNFKLVQYGDLNASDFSFSPSMLSLGDTKVTVTYKGKSTDQVVFVNEKQVENITLATDPAKKTYFIDQPLDVTGGEIKVSYDNGQKEAIPLTADMVSGFDSSTEGTKTLTVTYGGKTTTYDIIVKEAQVTSIALITPPTKKEYFTGDELDVTGGSINVYFEDNNYVNIALSVGMISGFDSTAAGTKTLSVNYAGKNTNFFVTVMEPKLTALELAAVPAKTEYSLGEALDVTGGKLTATYENNTTATIDITPDMVSGFDSMTSGTKTLTVKYSSQTVTFDITVKNSGGSVTPSQTTYPEFVAPVAPEVHDKLEIKAEVNGSTVKLSWNEINKADGYEVYQLINGKYVKITETTDTSATFEGLKNGETYKYIVRYVKKGRPSTDSHSAKATVYINYKPVAVASSEKDSVRLGWNAVPNAEKYAVYKYVDGKAVKLCETEKLAVRIKNLKPDTEYSYIIRAYVNGEWTEMRKSDIVTVSTKAE